MIKIDKKNIRIYYSFITAMFFAAVVLSSPLNAATPIVIDHTSVQNFDNIPGEYIEQAKSEFMIGYQHTSHGSKILEGMKMLSLENIDYSYSSISYQSISTITDAFLSDYCMYYYGAYDLGNPDRTAWVTATRNYLNNNGSNRNIIMWSWCGEASWASESDIADSYLANMNQLEQEYPNVKFIYMTGHLDGRDDSYLKERNQQIREYVMANNKILFDFADIESYDPDGTYYPDGSDACEWCSTWCESHTCPTCSDCAHSHCFNCC